MPVEVSLELVLPSEQFAALGALERPFARVGSPMSGQVAGPVEAGSAEIARIGPAVDVDVHEMHPERGLVVEGVRAQRADGGRECRHNFGDIVQLYRWRHRIRIRTVIPRGRTVRRRSSVGRRRKNIRRRFRQDFVRLPELFQRDRGARFLVENQIVRRRIRRRNDRLDR